MSDIDYGEPWKVVEGSDGDYGDYKFAEIVDSNKEYPLDGSDISDASHRVVACVNACAGLSDPVKEIAELKAQNEIMMEALRIMKAGQKSNQEKW